MTNVKHMKALLATAKSQFVSVVFEKADGSMRPITFNPKTAKGIKGEAASESSKKAVATRKANNPHLISVYDTKLASEGTAPDKCWRSVNLLKVRKMSIDGEKYEFDGE